MLSVFRRREKTRSDQPAEASPVIEPPALVPLEYYPDAATHLLDELRWLNRLVAAHVLRLRQFNFYDRLKDFRSFFIADEEVDALLQAGVFESPAALDRDRDRIITRLSSQAQQLREAISRRVEKSLQQAIPLPLVQLSRGFHLSEIELQALVIALAPLIDARYEKLYAYLQNDITKKAPSVDLLLGLMSGSLEQRLHLLPGLQSTSPLFRYRLLETIEMESHASAAQSLIRPDPRLLHYVLGQPGIDKRLTAVVRFLAPIKWEEMVITEAMRTQLAQFVRALKEQGSVPRTAFYLHGRNGAGKKTLARAMCGDLGVNVALVDLRMLLHNREQFSDLVLLTLREGLLQPCAVYFDHFEALMEASADHATLPEVLAQQLTLMGWLVFFGATTPMPPEVAAVLPAIEVEVAVPDAAAQSAIWSAQLENVGNLQSDIARLTASFNLTGGQIAGAVQRAKRAAWLREGDPTRMTAQDLLANCRVQSQPKLSTLARKIEPKFGWHDIVLPPDQMLQLREVAAQVRNRTMVMDDWGFSDKLSLGRGLNALFAGPSGTGKTMAAEVMANELALDLYKIDLSAVVSKYIGETEKNLNRVFSEAEHSNAILFFDEADALLGRRSEVKDAHDRYANIEIAYLLQKMEEYEGITVLATNLRQNIDEAFTRRIRFIIEFPFPDEQYRLRIWQGIWPAAIPLATEVDLNLLARQFKLTGGSIRNIALAAAFLASENGQVVRMKHLMQATRREFQKMGKVVREEEFMGVT